MKTVQVSAITALVVLAGSASGGWHHIAYESNLHSCHGLPALRMPVQ